MLLGAGEKDIATQGFVCFVVPARPIAGKRLPSGSSEKSVRMTASIMSKDSNLCTRREARRCRLASISGPSHTTRGISASGYHAALFSSGAAAGWKLKVWVGVEGDVGGANHRPTSHGGWQRRRRRVPAGVDASLRDGREVGPVRFGRAARGRPWRNFQCILVGVSLWNGKIRRWEDPTWGLREAGIDVFVVVGGGRRGWASARSWAAAARRQLCRP